MLITLILAGARADELLDRGRRVTERRWPEVFAAVLFLLGVAVAAFAAAALAGD